MKKKNTRKDKPQKQRPVFYLVMVLIPFIFFILLELTLRYFNYGTDLSQWIVSKNSYTLNPDLASRYFDKIQNLPGTIEDVFDITKQENSYRIFVLGGSSAAGFPYMPLGSFSRYLRQRLEQNYPERKIEVVNLGISAVNSYTILDLLPDVVEQKPDAIILYAGHNEYYGALGVGSLESFGRSRFMIKSLLFLNKFKTFLFIKDIVNNVFSKQRADSSVAAGTLMARMASDKHIPLNSELFTEGKKQFEKNLVDICEYCRDADVNLILGILTYNIKDQKPFIDDSSGSFPPASEVFQSAQKYFNEGHTITADSLFTLASDLDALRFRAPSFFNKIIKKTGRDFHFPVANIDSAFRTNCKGNIVGDEMMVDHLHASLKGYQLMGKVFYDCLMKNNLLPKGTPHFPYEIQDSITVANYLISDLDIQIADYMIEALKNDFPYVKPGEKRLLNYNLQTMSSEKRNAWLAAKHEINWAQAHITAAREAEQRKDFITFLEHMDILVYQYPDTEDTQDIIIQVLLDNEKYQEVLPYLLKRYEAGKNAFLSKWIGTIYFMKNNHAEAIKYLQESLAEKPFDTQNLYNIGAIYVLEGNTKIAKDYLARCLMEDPNHKEAKALMVQLK